MLQTELNRRRVMSGEQNPPCLEFTSDSDIALQRMRLIWDGYLEYSIDQKTWVKWESSSITVGKVLYLRGKGNTKLSDYDNHIILDSQTGVYCKGDIRSLLNYEDVENITMRDGCFQRLFYQNTKLITPPSLPITNLTNICYSGMFAGCSSLEVAPELPATILKKNCYATMFMGCTSLKESPILRAEVLNEYSYASMFNGCSQLNKITMLATNISASNALTLWVQGVAATGTFIKNPAMTTLSTGDSGIPSGWTVEDYSN